jgi:hypothetical protein
LQHCSSLGSFDGSLGKPLENFFSFDSLAHAISLPNESNSVIPVKGGSGLPLSRVPSLDLYGISSAIGNAMSSMEGGHSLTRQDAVDHSTAESPSSSRKRGIEESTEKSGSADDILSETNVKKVKE